ncbi:MAG: glucosaminidase domain-containing protein, partial [Taibaiella sp.]|nr:glucosaminidase domain-containing protein [Taibaiella sp.]
MIRYVLLCLAFLPFLAKAGAQDSFSCRAHRYIEQYYNLAIAEQRRSGVPASVTLAQGVLETEAGRSELVCMANNHFGIKCKSDYQGDKFFHDDDAPKECFKMYRCAEDSYKDHSDYLKRNPRYNNLFAISQTDYASWAVGLKRCGYATNPQYAQRLIRIIEDFKLQEYTYTAMDSTGLPGMAATVWPVAKDSAQKIIPQPVSNIALAAPPPPLTDTAKKAIAAATLADTAKVTA